jgi:uncharacterized protein YaiI (UPF0178 family)
MRVPDHPLIERVVVSDKFDAADDWIAEQADAKTVVITGDILLADRCLKAGATVIGPNGKPFTAASIGGAIATRAIMADLRAAATGSPAARRRSPRRTGRGSCRRWTRRWCGWGRAGEGQPGLSCGRCRCGRDVAAHGVDHDRPR